MSTDKTLEMCLREMFRRVGARYSKKACKEEDWFRKRSWTSGQEEDFRKWMSALLRKRHRWTKAAAEKEVGWFVLMYAWRNPPDGCLAVEGGKEIGG